MKTIGIIGGMAPASTAEFYKLITDEYFFQNCDVSYPEIIIHSVNFQKFIDCGYRCEDEIQDVIDSLWMAGADFVVCPCNSAHVVHADVSVSSNIPWYSIMEAVGDEIRSLGITRVGLLGTRFTLASGIYSYAGVKVIKPYNVNRINEIIYTELVHGIFKNETRNEVLGMLNQLESEGCEGVILGCTEIPLLIKQENTDVKVFPSTDILAVKTLERAYN